MHTYVLEYGLFTESIKIVRYSKLYKVTKSVLSKINFNRDKYKNS